MIISRRACAILATSLLLLTLSALPALAAARPPQRTPSPDTPAAQQTDSALIDFTLNVRAARGDQSVSFSAPPGSNVALSRPGLFVGSWSDLLPLPSGPTPVTFTMTGRLLSVHPLVITFRTLSWRSGVGEDLVLLDATRSFPLGDNQFSIGPVVSSLGISYTLTGTMHVRLAELHVDAAAGDDTTADGSSARPFKTITAALAAATAGQTVAAAAGTYQAPDEQFPLVIPPGIQLKGNSSTDTVIRGTATSAVLRPATNAIVRGFKVVNATSGLTGTVAAVWIDGASPTIEDNEITTSGASDGCRTGVLVTGSVVPAVIRDNEIRGNRSQTCGGTGVLFLSGTAPASTALVQGNLIEDNDVGVEARSGQPQIKGNRINENDVGLLASCSGAGCSVGGLAQGNRIRNNQTGVSLGLGAEMDFGGGANNSAGDNSFTCNQGIDFFNGTLAIVWAQSNRWDHVPPAGNDLVNLGAESRTTTEFARLVNVPCP